jgi:hypothetical protein
MADIGVIEEHKDGISFNLFLTRGDGQIAWTVTPVTIDDLYSDPLSGYIKSTFADSRTSSFFKSTRETS